MNVAIVGGGICGLSLALNLSQRGVACRVYERAPEIKELGVGITLLPHAMREFSALGLGDALLKTGIENRESRFYNRFGQLIYREERGKFAGYPFPEVGIHRGKLHLILYDAVKQRLGADAVVTDCECDRASSRTSTARPCISRNLAPAPSAHSVRADVVIACDGINSAIRKQFYPDDKVAFTGINTWRGVTRRKPILDGRTYMRVGSILTGKIVIYPIVDDVDGAGNQLINWMAEIKRDTVAQNDWNKPAISPTSTRSVRKLAVRLARRRADDQGRRPDPGISHGGQGPDRALDLRPRHAGRRCRPPDVPARFQRRGAGRDRRAHAGRLLGGRRPTRATRSRPMRTRRAAPAAKVVRTNREHPPDFINIKVEELVGDQAVRRSRQIHHPGRAAGLVGELQAHRRLCAGGCGAAAGLTPRSPRTGGNRS